MNSHSQRTKETYEWVLAARNRGTVQVLYRLTRIGQVMSTWQKVEAEKQPVTWQGAEGLISFRHSYGVGIMMDVRCIPPELVVRCRLALTHGKAAGSGCSVYNLAVNGADGSVVVKTEENARKCGSVL